ncbi:hypothetical protein ABE85_03015 [Mitsuaria sp. 7]|nr:hypothetical protein ABE85_03015 [Mitsuaria sp. 7]
MTGGGAVRAFALCRDSGCADRIDEGSSLKSRSDPVRRESRTLVEFMAHARQDVLYLISELRWLAEMLKFQ